MQKRLKILDPLFKKALPGYEQIISFPSQGQEVETQKRRNRSDTRAGICPPGQYLEADIHVPVYNTVVPVDLIAIKTGGFQFLVKKEAGAGAETSIDNSKVFFS